MLARENRLRQARDIARVYKQGVYGGAGGVLSVKAAPSGRTQSRAVVVVGKKVDKRAVVRNRNRRRILGIISARWATVRPGYDIVVSVHSDTNDLSQTALQDHIDQAMSRAKLI